MRRANRALTLVELLVVISISLLLMALLAIAISNMSYIVAVGKSTSNLRSMSSALLIYANDHDGRLLEGSFRPRLHGTTVRFWFNALDYYLGGDDYTPEGSRRAERPHWQNDPLKVFDEPLWDGPFAVNVGYGWNHAEFGYSPGTKGWASRLADIDEPGQTIIMGTSKEIPEGVNVTLGNLLIYADRLAAKRYRGKGLYVFIDGHIEALTPEEVMANNRYLFRKHKPIRD